MTLFKYIPYSFPLPVHPSACLLSFVLLPSLCPSILLPPVSCPPSLYLSTRPRASISCPPNSHACNKWGVIIQIYIPFSDRPRSSGVPAKSGRALIFPPWHHTASLISQLTFVFRRWFLPHLTSLIKAPAVFFYLFLFFSFGISSIKH